jgi:hypothetical protein
MKKIYFFALFLALIGTKANAQITLVNTINESMYDASKFTNLDGSNGYVIPTASRNIIKVYNADFSLNRTITLNIPNFNDIIEIDRYNGIDKTIYGSTHLFNNNASLEFVVKLKNNTTGIYSVAVVDENSNILFSKDAVAGVGWVAVSFITSSTNIYMLIHYETSSTIYKTEIYSLPGTERFDCCSSSSTPTGTVSPVERFMSSPFSNPAQTSVNLTYTLPEGNQGKLSVYDLSGKLLKTVTVDGSFPYVTLDVSNYKPATYVYKVACNGTTASNKFVIAR